jgi:hypothetical protein
MRPIRALGREYPCMIDTSAQQIVGRRQLDTLVVHNEGEILQVVVVVGHEQIEHEPPIQAHPGTRPIAAAAHELGKALQSRVPILEGARLVEQLAGIDDMTSLRLPNVIHVAVEALDDIHRLWRIAS